MNMEKKVFDDTQLLIQNEKPVKIYLDGFPIEEFVELVKTVKDHGGEISSRVAKGVMVLSRPNRSFETDSPKFHVDWLYDCIRSDRILNASKYLLELPTTSIKPKVEVEDHHPIGPMNVRLHRENNAADCYGRRETTVSKISSLPKKHALPYSINENLDILENPLEIQRTPKRKCSQPPVYTICDSPEENKSLKSQLSVCTTSRLMSSPIVSSSRVESSTSNIKVEVEKEDDRHVQRINVGLQQQENAADDNNMKGNMIRMSGVSSSSQTMRPSLQKHALPKIINENPVPKTVSEIQSTPECRRCSQPPIYTIDDSPEENESSKNKCHLYTTSSPPNSPTVSSYRVESATSNIMLAVEEEDDRHVQQMNVGLQQEKNADEYNNVRKYRIRISKVVPSPQTNASTDDNNTVSEDTSKIPEKSKRRRGRQKPVYTICESSEEDESLEHRCFYYTKTEDRTIIQYLIDNKAIGTAGRLEIWQKMHKDGLMQHHTARALMSHFRRSLHHRIQDFISDEEVLREFQLLNIEPKRRGKKRCSSDQI